MPVAYIVKDFLQRAMNVIFSISIFSLHITSNPHISGFTKEILIIFALLETWFQALKYLLYEVKESHFLKNQPHSDRARHNYDVLLKSLYIMVVSIHLYI